MGDIDGATGQGWEVDRETRLALGTISRLGILESVVLDCVAQNRHLCSDRLLELLPMPADEAMVYSAVERLQHAGLLDAYPSRGPDAPRFGHICLTEQGKVAVGK